ncbi:MAG: alanine:cation symporter family protein, partial [Bacteroidales bacterium]|nr:alanine:cation symporter family protein [Bacteroidales bacterium]
FMAIFYILGCIAILIMNWNFLDETIILIFKSAFSPQAAGAGFLGGTVMMAARYGIARGLFSNESGLGSAPIIAAAAKTRNSVRQALVSSTGTFWDTVVVCALTGLVIVSSVIAYPDINASETVHLTQKAFSKLPYIGNLFLNISIITFAFSTILGWSYYGEKAIEYLGGKKTIIYYRLTWVVIVFIGAVINLDLVWNISDTMNALMAIPNLISVLLLSGVIVKETKKYLWSNKLDEYDPNCEL